MRLFRFLCIVLVVTVQDVEANHLVLKNISIPDGLSNMNITSISSDEYLNRIHRMVIQTFRNNLIQGIPLSNTNSEKYGWNTWKGRGSGLVQGEGRENI